MNADLLMKLDTCAGDPLQEHTTLKDHLTSLGLHPMDQYCAILRHLYHGGGHLSAEDIQRALQPMFPDLSRTRTQSILEILARLGAVNALIVDRYTILYDAITVPHAHFICKDCGKVIDISLKEGTDYGLQVPAGICVDNVDIVLKGTCQECLADLG